MTILPAAGYFSIADEEAIADALESTGVRYELDETDYRAECDRLMDENADLRNEVERLKADALVDLPTLYSMRRKAAYGERLWRNLPRQGCWHITSTKAVLIEEINHLTRAVAIACNEYRRDWQNNCEDID